MKNIYNNHQEYYVYIISFVNLLYHSYFIIPNTNKKWNVIREINVTLITMI